MRGPGILWMLQTAAGMSMAGPMFVVGIDFLRTGRPVFGVAFLAFGAIALYFPTYLVNRIGGPRTWIRRRLRRRGSSDSGSESASDSDSESEGEANADSSDTDDASDGESPFGRLERLRRR